ncbi:DUF4352 domain-containing protein [Streptomonospora alba]|uniref:DUF4352 domain-containing protein n=1 Tax=Streptomonospora alba TaxID=183763 RepID=UPI00069B5057|nr:DUF4352 domain-containing protein [Streptomonospora alba]
MYSQYPPQPQPYPPPQPEKKPNYWLIGCFGCGGALALVLGVVLIFAVVVNSGGDDEAGGSGGGASASPEEAGNGQGEETAPVEEEPVGSGEPVEIVAEPAEYRPGPLADGGDYVAAQVTITNNGDETLAVNPLYFSMEDGSGQSRDASLTETVGQDDGFEALELDTGESESGVVAFPGTSEPVSVTHTSVMGESYTAEVG